MNARIVIQRNGIGRYRVLLDGCPVEIWVGCAWGSVPVEFQTRFLWRAKWMAKKALAEQLAHKASKQWCDVGRIPNYPNPPPPPPPRKRQSLPPSGGS